MSSKRTLLLKKFSNGKTRKPQKNILSSLPSIGALNGRDFDDNTMQLDENRHSRVVRIKPFSFPLTEKERIAFAVTLEELVRTSELDLQVVVTSKLVDVDRALEGFNQGRAMTNEYLRWLGDYTHKWFARVADVSCIPTREFYLVASTARIAEENSFESFEHHFKDLMQHMERMKLEPKILKRCELRKLLYSNLRLSFTEISEQPVEMLSPSSIPDVEIQEFKNHLIVDSTFVATYTMTEMASNVWQGWLAKLLMSPIKRFVASLHLQKCDVSRAIEEAKLMIGSNNRTLRELEKDVSKDKCTIVDASFHLATFAETATELEHASELVRKFSQKTAIVQLATNQQFDAWQSCLPIGVNNAGVSHRIKSNDATSLWLGYSDQTGHITGFPFAYGRASEPVLLGPARGSIILIAGSNEEERRLAQTLLTIRMAVTDYSILQFSGSHNLKHLLSALGPGLSAVIGSDGLDDMSLLKATGFDKTFALRCVDLSTTNGRCPKGSLNRFAKVCQLFAESEDARVPVIIIPDLSAFAESPEGFEALEKIIGTAKSLNSVLIINSNTGTLRQSPKISEMILEASETRLIMPQTKVDADFARDKILGCGDSSTFETLARLQFPKDVWCYLTTPHSIGLVRLVMSPMEYWMYSESADDEALREAMWQEVRTKNPKLSNTDAARQSVYYLGLQHN